MVGCYRHLLWPPLFKSGAGEATSHQYWRLSSSRTRDHGHLYLIRQRTLPRTVSFWGSILTHDALLYSFIPPSHTPSSITDCASVYAARALWPGLDSTALIVKTFSPGCSPYLIAPWLQYFLPSLKLWAWTFSIRHLYIHVRNKSSSVCSFLGRWVP